MPELTKSPNLIQLISTIMPHYCDKCGSKYDNSADLEIVSNNNGRAVCKLNCKNCGNSYMIHAHATPEGMFSAKRTPFKSEITSKEINKFSNTDRIDSDEIIDVYSSMKSVSTIEDFNKLFAE